MNLTDLRTELAARATEPDRHPAGLLAGVHRKINRTRRRRVAGILAGTAAVAALAVGVLPGLTTTGETDPADTPGSDYVEHGVVLPGRLGADLLVKGAIGTLGESRLEFGWTPTTAQTTLHTFCPSLVPRLSLRIQVNGHHVADHVCADTGNRPDPDRGTVLRPDSTVWLDAPIGKLAGVTVTLVDEHGLPVSDPTAQLALGIYRSGSSPVSGPPSRTPPTSPDDYAKDGIRYRAEVGGSTLTAAAVGEPGQSAVTLRFTATEASIGLRDFCTAPYGDPQYEVVITLNGQARTSSGCDSASTDAGGGGEIRLLGDSNGIRPGQVVEATIRLQDRTHRPVSLPGMRLGLGIYRQGPQRPIDGGTSLDEVREHQGYLYRLTDVQTTVARAGARIRIATPQHTPFLIAFGSKDVGSSDTKIQLSSERDGQAPTTSALEGGGLGTDAVGAGRAGLATLSLVAGKPTKGHLILAVYTLKR
jgi:hypothetical protein